MPGGSWPSESICGRAGEGGSPVFPDDPKKGMPIPHSPGSFGVTVSAAQPRQGGVLSRVSSTCPKALSFAKADGTRSAGERRDGA